MRRYFQISCHALMISAFAALALTGRLDTPSIVFFTIGLMISVYRTIKGLPEPLSPRMAFVLSCVYILFFLFDMMILSASFIPASIHLVLFLQIAKLYQEKTDRDYLYLIVLSFLQILAASSLTIDMSFVAMLFLFLVALVSTLMSFDMYRAQRSKSMDTQRVAAPLSGMSLWATVWIVVLGVVLFLLIPRVGTNYFTRAASPSLLISGFEEAVQLGQIGHVKLSSAVVMHARLVNGPPSAVLKWRGITLDRFDGHNWYKTDRRRRQIRVSPDGEYLIQPVADKSNVAQYEMFLEPLATNALFAPYQVREISGRLQGVEYDNDESVYMRFPTARRTQYQVVSEIPKRKIENASESNAGQTIPPEISPRYLQIPRNIDPRIADLARTITARGRTAFEKASLVESYLKRNYKYTLNLTWDPGSQPISTFLFDAKSGHCEYFASSMAILLRSAGIPTRLINGFQMGEYNPVSGDYIIRESDAHSWIEAYVPGRGWTEFDPTPPDPNHREMSLGLQISQYFDAMELFWNSYVLVYDIGSQSQLFRNAQESVQSMQFKMRTKADKWVVQGQEFSDNIASYLGRIFQVVWFWIAVVIVVICSFIIKGWQTIRLQFWIWKIRRGHGGQIDEDVVEELFYRAARLAEHKSPKRRPAQTWREWIFALPDPNRRTILERALAVFEKSKYGRLPASGADFALMEEVLRELKSPS